MRIMIKASMYNRYKDIFIAIDGDGSIRHVGVSNGDGRTSNIFYGYGITGDTDAIEKEAK